MPRKGISQAQLSQLLLAYLGISSDIMDLFTLLPIPVVLQDEYLCLAIMGVWSVSLLQFTLVLTATRNPTQRKSKKGLTLARRTIVIAGDALYHCCETEIWSILITMCLHDVPCFVLRLYIIIYKRVWSYSLIFYVLKNVFVILVQFYRMFVIAMKSEHNQITDNVVTDINLQTCGGGQIIATASTSTATQITVIGTDFKEGTLVEVEEKNKCVKNLHIFDNLGKVCIGVKIWFSKTIVNIVEWFGTLVPMINRIGTLETSTH